MTETTMRQTFVKQRAEMAAAVKRVQHRQVDATKVQDTWSPLRSQLEQGVLPMLSQSAEELSSAPTDIALHEFERSQRRLVRLGQGLWRHHHLIQVRIRNAGLWLIAYRREIMMGFIAITLLGYIAAAMYFVIANFASIAALTRSIIDEFRQLLPTQP